MHTNFSDVKAGFQAYLENLYGKEQINNDNAQGGVNLFDYNDELKDYLENELNIDVDSIEGSLSEILDRALIANINAVNTNQGNNNGFVTEYLFDLLRDNDFVKTIDLNGDSKLDNDEIKEFMEYISLNDNNAENVSYKDIYDGVNSVKNGEYIKDQLDAGNTTLDVANQILDNLSEIQAEQAGNIQQTATQNINANTGASGASGGSGSGDDTDEAIWVSGQTSLAGKTEEELLEIKAEKQEKADEQRERLNSVYDGSDSGVKTREQNVQAAYELYMRRLDEEKVDKTRLQEKISQIDAKEAQIDAQEIKISNQEAKIQQNENAYNSAKSTKENLESALSALQGASSDDPDEQAAIEAQIASVTSALNTAKAKEEETKKTLEYSKRVLEKMEATKETYESDLAALNSEKDQIEAEILQTIGPNIAEAMNGYNNAKENLNTYKENTAENIKAQIDASEKEVSEIEKTITDNKNRNDNIEYSPNLLSKAIVQEALKYLGDNEADASADKFLYKWHSSSRQTGWCAAFVSYVMEQVANNTDLDIPDWYEEIENQYWQVNVHRAAEKENELIESNQAQPGDIVLFDYDGDGTMQHIGIVYAIEGDMMYTIEGNSGNCVKVNEYDLSNPVNQNITYVNIVGKK